MTGTCSTSMSHRRTLVEQAQSGSTMKGIEMDELLTLVETSERLRVPAATLRWWRHTSQGPSSFRVGRRVMYKRDVVEHWLEEQAQSDRTAQP